MYIVQTLYLQYQSLQYLAPAQCKRFTIHTI